MLIVISTKHRYCPQLKAFKWWGTGHRENYGNCDSKTSCGFSCSFNCPKSTCHSVHLAWSRYSCEPWHEFFFLVAAMRWETNVCERLVNIRWACWVTYKGEEERKSRRTATWAITRTAAAATRSTFHLWFSCNPKQSSCSAVNVEISSEISRLPRKTYTRKFLQNVPLTL